MTCKPIDDALVDMGDGDVRLIEPIAEMPDASFQRVNGRSPIPKDDQMIDIRLN
jgi:hypothetical protein